MHWSIMTVESVNKSGEKQVIYDAIIVGGGPAGLMAANTLQSKQINYLLLEKNERVGKKLLITGGKRCNVTNNLSVDAFIQSLNLKHRNFLYTLLESFSSQDILEFFKAKGLNLVLEEGFKYFPETQMSSSVLEALMKDLKTKQIKVNHSVKRITEANGVFTIHTQHENFLTRNVIIATGSNSYPTTGSSGDGLHFAEYLGINYDPFTPAETHVYSSEINAHYDILQGVTIRDTILSIQGVKKTFHGDVLFTHFGLSGPAVLHASEDIYKALLNQKIDISFSLVNQSEGEVKSILTHSSNQSNMIKKVLETITTPRLAMVCLNKVSVDNKNIAELSHHQLDEIIRFLCHFTISIDRVEDKEHAFVNAGGIHSKELIPHSMESKKIKGLYFIGETVDLHGPIGGFNITIALSTGYACASDIINTLKGEHI